LRSFCAQLFCLKGVFFNKEHRPEAGLLQLKVDMDTIKKLLVIFVLNTLVMLVSWAGLSLILLGFRFFIGPGSDMAKIFSIHSYIVVMFFYAFYMIYDVCQYVSAQTRGYK
jgi:uncharacterized membrane protein